MKKIFNYLNPIERLGNNEYSFIFPLVANVALCILSEVYSYGIVHDPMAVGTYIIFINVAFIIYFSFRDGISGGIISTIITVLYYFYIIYNRPYDKTQIATGIDTALSIGVIYILLAIIIGWLKQTIDKLIGREANEKLWLQLILQQLAVGVIITDNKGRVLQTNNQLENILGIKLPSGYILGKDKHLIRRSSTNIPFFAKQSSIYQALKAHKSIIRKEFAMRRNDGKDIFVQVDSSVIRNKNNRIVAAASIISDITQEKELERQKDDFLSMASHELKTPITSLKMFIDLQTQQLKENDATKAVYYNERIRDQANRLKELTNDLLDVSRIQTNKLGLKTEDFDIAEVIHDIVESIQGTTKAHKIIIKNTKKQIVKADRYRIYQVLVNLLSNAIKYSPRGKKIFVQINKDKNSIVVSVQDFGIGISKSQQERIFDRLYQVSEPRERTYPGLGLGLYISKEIVERHKGNLWVESQKGKGSTFFFSLPL